MKICSHCKEQKPPEAFYKKQSWCRSCQLAAARQRRLADPEHFREYHRLYNYEPINRAKSLFRKAKLRADQKNIPFSLSVEKIYRALLKGVCERTGVPLSLEGHDVYSRNPLAPSIDKIDAFGPYSDDNTLIVCNAYNIGKHQMTHDEYVDFCRKVVEYDNAKNGART